MSFIKFQSEQFIAMLTSSELQSEVKPEIKEKEEKPEKVPNPNYPYPGELPAPETQQDATAVTA
jgi:hypothetical protein